jgi:hypothetical protein
MITCNALESAPVLAPKAYDAVVIDACHPFIANVAESPENPWMSAMPFFFAGSGNTGSVFSRKGVDRILNLCSIWCSATEKASDFTHQVEWHFDHEALPGYMHLCNGERLSHTRWNSY